MVELLSGEMSHLWQLRITKVDDDAQEEVSWFLTEEDAKEEALLARKPGIVSYVKAFQVLKQKMGDGRFTYWKVERVQIQSEPEIRQQALAKLTSIEKRVLGL